MLESVATRRCSSQCKALENLSAACRASSTCGTPHKASDEAGESSWRRVAQHRQPAGPAHWRCSRCGLAAHGGRPRSLYATLNPRSEGDTEYLETGNVEALAAYSGDLFRARFASRLWMRRLVSSFDNRRCWRLPAQVCACPSSTQSPGTYFSAADLFLMSTCSSLLLTPNVRRQEYCREDPSESFRSLLSIRSSNTATQINVVIHTCVLWSATLPA